MSEATKTQIPSQHSIRAELESYVLGDLVGPVGGEGEELTERSLRGWHLGPLMNICRATVALTHTICDEPGQK